ncbi:MAG: hypothetical protein LBT40_17125, partial [Deltaproteobacteria bacterium]|nr:hypothetical protein [Deltaproteobacteria bacterium]
PRDWVNSALFRPRIVRTGYGTMNLAIDPVTRVGFRGMRFPGLLSAFLLAELTCQVLREKLPRELSGWGESVMRSVYGRNFRAESLPEGQEFLPAAFGLLDQDSLAIGLRKFKENVSLRGVVISAIAELSNVHVFETDVNRTFTVGSPVMVLEPDKGSENFRFVLHPHLARSVLGETDRPFFSSTRTFGGQSPVRIPLEEIQLLKGENERAVYLFLLGEPVPPGREMKVGIAYLARKFYGDESGVRVTVKHRDNYMRKILETLGRRTRMKVRFLPGFPDSAFVKLPGDPETPKPPEERRPHLTLVK